jgi:hypothetical protein
MNNELTASPFAGSKPRTSALGQVESGRVLGGETAPSRKIQLGHILENEPLLERIWNQTDAHAYMFVYQCLLSF